jgi:AcrR family transcriptional regulator
MPPTASQARRRRPRHDPRETEREILDAAEQLLRERRFREVTVEEVMRRTGLQRPAFYAHFRDRHDLALRVVQRIGDQLFAMADRWLDGGPDEVRPALEGIAAVYAEHGPVLRALADAAGSDAQVEAAYRGLVDSFIAATARHIDDEQQAGRAGPELDPQETARALVWSIERYFSDAFGREPPADREKVVAVVERIWVATLYGGRLAQSSR